MLPAKREREPNLISGYLPPLFLTGTLPGGLELYYEDYLPLRTENDYSKLIFFGGNPDYFVFKSNDPSFTLYFNDISQYVGIGIVTLFIPAMCYIALTYTTSQPNSVRAEGWLFVLREKDPTRNLLCKLSAALNFSISNTSTWMHIKGTLYNRIQRDGRSEHVRLTIKDMEESEYFEMRRKIDVLIRDGILSYKDYPFVPPSNGWMMTELGHRYPDDAGRRHAYNARSNETTSAFFSPSEELADLQSCKTEGLSDLSGS